MQENYNVVFTEKSHVEVWEADIPELGADEVLVETEISQISTGTELTMLEANVEEDSLWHRNIRFPNFPGYSNVGRVIAVGKEVDESLLGKRVCSNAKHAKYGKTKAENVIIVPENVESEEAVFATIAQICMGSIRVADIRLGDTVLVYGAGLIGQIIARLAKNAGAGYVFVTDVSDSRLDLLPEEAGFHKVNSTKEDVVEALNSRGKKELARVVFETTGVSALISKELLCVQKLGRLIITSSPKGKSLVDFDYCNRQGISIIGAHNYTVHTSVATPRDPWTRCADSQCFIDMLSRKEISVKNMNTHKEHYTKAPELYEMLMKDRTQALSVLIDWRD